MLSDDLVMASVTAVVCEIGVVVSSVISSMADVVMASGETVVSLCMLDIVDVAGVVVSALG